MGMVWYGMVWYGMVCKYVSTCMHDSHTLLQCSENDPQLLISRLVMFGTGLTEKCRPCLFFLLDLKVS